MNLDVLRDELARLAAIDAPSGFEEPILGYSRERLRQLADTVELDVRGNLYATRPGSDSAASRVMLIAHADQIGFLVTRITDDGFLRFAKLGGPTHTVLPGQRVRVLAGAPTVSTPVEGTIGVKPGHILSAEEARQVPPLSELYIDVAAESRAQAESWGIEVGTPAVFFGPVTPTNNPHRVIGATIDDRAGLTALFHIAERFKTQALAPTVVYCVSVEEEIGLRGAEVAAKHVLPDLLIALDTVPAGGTPDLKADDLPWAIGRGPLIKVREQQGLITHRPLRELFRRVADEHRVPYQLVVDTAGVTDATSAQQASGAIAALTLGLPRRYSHSAVEMLDLRDLAALIELVVLTLPRLTTKEMLLRI